MFRGECAQCRERPRRPSDLDQMVRFTEARSPRYRDAQEGGQGASGRGAVNIQAHPGTCVMDQRLSSFDCITGDITQLVPLRALLAFWTRLGDLAARRSR